MLRLLDAASTPRRYGSDMTGERPDGFRVLVVDDHPVFRRGLAGLLAKETWVTAVLEAGTLDEAVRQAVTGKPDVVAMDLRLPDGDGIAATARILRARPTATVLVLTMTEDDARVREALRAGARGYVLKRSEPDDIVRALHTVARRGWVLDPEVGRPVLTDLPDPLPVKPTKWNLNERQMQILALLARGLTNTAIARELDLAEKTVRNSIGPILTAIQARDRVDGVLKAREAGFGGAPPADRP
jgi:two-component system, NarL family, nitrate/nitrite response regulator NarL